MNSPKAPWPAPVVVAVVKPLTEEQKRINAAIEGGVEYLKKSQRPQGMWGPATNGGHSVGHAALPGLALLECQVPPSHPAVQNAAAFVRFQAGQLNMTYDLALAILFLDRLGEAKDVPLIQTLAMRLIAGQNAAGGWNYFCPILQPPDSKKLLTLLQARQARLSDPIKSTGTRPLDTAVEKERSLGAPISGSGANSASAEKKAILPMPVGPSEPEKDVRAMPKNLAPPRIDSLPAPLRQLPVLMFTKKIGLVQNARDDNSNTQFALLGLWAARRHNVPVEKSLEIADLRFQKSQNRDGGWGYQINSGSSNTMTCVGLLGLAMGHGAAEAQKKEKKTQEDKAISQGLRLLGKLIQRGTIKADRNEFYFLWSVERVGMLYNLKTIGGVDWYKWGSQIILLKQNGDGAWRIEPGYDPAIDTSFALLFLKRSNLVQDLSNRLPLYLAITDPSSSQRK